MSNASFSPKSSPLEGLRNITSGRESGMGIAAEVPCIPFADRFAADHGFEFHATTPRKLEIKNRHRLTGCQLYFLARRYIEQDEVGSRHKVALSIKSVDIYHIKIELFRLGQIIPFLCNDKSSEWNGARTGCGVCTWT